MRALPCNYTKLFLTHTVHPSLEQALWSWKVECNWSWCWKSWLCLGKRTKRCNQQLHRWKRCVCYLTHGIWEIFMLYLPPIHLWFYACSKLHRLDLWLRCYSPTLAPPKPYKRRTTLVCALLLTLRLIARVRPRLTNKTHSRSVKLPHN